MISKYILEQRKGRLGSWTKVKELESYQHSATIKHLEPDCEYGFRVKAKNSEGFSEAVELESSIKSSKPPGELSLISNQWFENCECPTFLSLYTQFRLLKIWIFLSYVYGFFFRETIQTSWTSEGWWHYRRSSQTVMEAPREWRRIQDYIIHCGEMWSPTPSLAPCGPTPPRLAQCGLL